MEEHGANGLSLSEIARRLGVKPPSLYKYFDSLMSLYNELFARGQRANLAAMQAAARDADPGLDTLTRALEASCRWCIEHPATAQLMFWRPVPGFEPTPEAMAPSAEMVALQRRALADAVVARQLGPGADSDEALYLTSVLVSGIIGQSIANEPAAPWGKGRFNALFPKVAEVLASQYPPPMPPAGSRRTRKRP